MKEVTLLKILKASKLTTLCAAGVNALASSYIHISNIAAQNAVNQKLDARSESIKAKASAAV